MAERPRDRPAAHRRTWHFPEGSPEHRTPGSGPVAPHGLLLSTPEHRRGQGKLTATDSAVPPGLRGEREGTGHARRRWTLPLRPSSVWGLVHLFCVLGGRPLQGLPAGRSTAIGMLCPRLKTAFDLVDLGTF